MKVLSAIVLKFPQQFLMPKLFWPFAANSVLLTKYIWQFVDGKTQKNHFPHYKKLPAKTPASDAMSQDLKKRGFNFVGSTICYAFMQATGMVNDHSVECFRYAQLSRKRR